MGQPGHSVINRLGISNFWHFNTVGIRKEKKNFLNNFIIKQVLINFVKYKNYFFYEFFYNNKWFEYNKNNLNINMFWRTKPIILKLIIYRKTLKVNNIRTRICHLNVFSSKIQIFRYEDWIIVIWFIYDKYTKTQFIIEHQSKFLKKYITMYESKIPLFYIKYFILYKLKYYKSLNTYNVNYINN